MRVTVKFVGGPWDGTVLFQFPLEEPNPLPAVLNAAGFYALTNGQVGSATNNISPAQMEALGDFGPEQFLKRPKVDCIYRVVYRNEDAGEVFIRAQFCPTKNLR